MLNTHVLGFYCSVDDVIYPFFRDGMLRQFLLDLSTLEDRPPQTSVTK
jgi:hypothetical protein